MLSAYLLVSHGSRDPRPQIAVDALAQMLREKVQATYSDRVSSQKLYSSARITSVRQPFVGTATLELASQPLHEQIRQFGSQALALGYQRLQIVPLFLLPGVHVSEDIPAEVTQVQPLFGNALEVEIRPHLGSHPRLGQLLTPNDYRRKIGLPEARILLSHGSRRVGGNEAVEAIAESLGAIAAYWSVKPSLEDQLDALARKGEKQVEILLYFLFPGGITDAIAQLVIQRQAQFPSLKLKLGEPIGVSESLAQLILELIL